MARPRKPDETHILEGTFRKDRHGDPTKSFVADGEPAPPEFLKDEALAFWHEIVPALVQKNIAKAIDAYQLAEMCKWWALERKLDVKLDEMQPGDPKMNSLIVTKAIASDKFDRIAAKFGFTPSDRSKLRMPETESKPKGLISRKRA